eukprot:g4123.t1
MAEFDYDGNPLESFPFDQGVCRETMFLFKRYVFPFMYWKTLITGNWAGPGLTRKLINPLGNGVGPWTPPK